MKHDVAMTAITAITPSTTPFPAVLAEVGDGVCNKIGDRLSDVVGDGVGIGDGGSLVPVQEWQTLNNMQIILDKHISKL